MRFMVERNSKPPNGVSLKLIALVFAAAVLFIGCSKSTEPEPKPAPPPEKTESKSYIGPEITILAPPRAGMVKAGTQWDEYAVDINAAVCDSFHTVVLCKIEDNFVDLAGTSPCEPIAFQKNTRRGLSIVHGTLENDEGWIGYLAHSFLRSPDFYPAAVAPSPDARAGHALSMYLMQDFFDDGNRSDLDDLASILQYYLNHFDKSRWEAMIPLFSVRPKTADDEPKNGPGDADDGDGEVDKTTYDCGVWPVTWHETNHETCVAFKRTPLTMGTYTTSIALTESEMDITVRLSLLAIDANIKGYLDLACLGETNGTLMYGWLYFPDIEFNMKASMSLDPASGKPQVDVTAFDITIADQTLDQVIDGMVVDWGCGPLGFLCDAMGGDWLADKLRGVLKDQLGSLNKVPPMIEDLINGVFEGLQPSYDIQLPGELARFFDQKLMLETGFDRFEIIDLPAQGAALTVSNYIQAYPERPVAEHAQQYGAIEYGSAMPVPCSSCAYGLGIRDDFMNQFLWALWLGGAFDMDDLSEFVADPASLSGFELSIFSNLPPVIQATEEPGGVELAWGDIFIDVTVTPQELARLMAASGRSAQMPGDIDKPIHVEAYMSAILRVDSLLVEESNGSLRFRAAFNPDPEIYAQITAIHDPELGGLMNAELEGKLRKEMKAALMKISEKTLGSFPIPALTIPAMYGFPSMKLTLRNFDVERQDTESLHFISGNLLAVPK